jgi:hypothetical protein
MIMKKIWTWIAEVQKTVNEIQSKMLFGKF